MKRSRVAAGSKKAKPARPAVPGPPAHHHMWGGRFASGPAEAFDRLNRSLPVDHRLWPQDIAGSRAWARALVRAGVLTAAEGHAMVAGLDRVAQRLGETGAAEAADEDVHTLVERMLFEEVGGLAGKLHSGRSRNDQVATDLRLWCLDALDTIDREIVALGQALVMQARAGLDVVMPGYTHGQRAQPVRWGYVVLAHAWPLSRDRERLAQTRRRVGVLPLGSGALAGSGLAVDRRFLQEQLGFHDISGNGLDATGDRDFVAEILFDLALLATHVSRLGGEIYTLASTEYGFVRLADAYCSGSSLMPQKRNPDTFELARAKPARVLGDLVALLATLKGLPAGYNKDLQEDKAPLFDAVDTVLVTLPAVRGAIETLQARPDRMKAALDVSLLATDVADGLVVRGVPFREAHGLVGRLVRVAEETGTDITRVPAAKATAIHPQLPAVISGLGSWEDSIERRATDGGSSRASVLSQIRELDKEFAGPTPAGSIQRGK